MAQVDQTAQITKRNAKIQKCTEVLHQKVRELEITTNTIQTVDLLGYITAELTKINHDFSQKGSKEISRDTCQYLLGLGDGLRLIKDTFCIMVDPSKENDEIFISQKCAANEKSRLTNKKSVL